MTDLMLAARRVPALATAAEGELALGVIVGRIDAAFVEEGPQRFAVREAIGARRSDTAGVGADLENSLDARARL